MSAASAAAASARPPRHAPAGTNDGAVPAHARQLAAQLSALFDRDVKIVKQLNDAQRLLAGANQRLRPGLAPDALSLIHDDAGAAAIGNSPIAALIRDGRPAAADSHMLEALQQIHWEIHRAFCAYQNACEQRRQLAVDVGELSQHLTQALCAAGWSTDQARHANVHEHARRATTPLDGQPEPLHVATPSRSSKRSRTPTLHH